MRDRRAGLRRVRRASRSHRVSGALRKLARRPSNQRRRPRRRTLYLKRTRRHVLAASPHLSREGSQPPRSCTPLKPWPRRVVPALVTWPTANVTTSTDGRLHGRISLRIVYSNDLAGCRIRVDPRPYAGADNASCATSAEFRTRLLSDQLSDYRVDDPHTQAHVYGPSPRSLLALDDSQTELRDEEVSGSRPSGRA